MSRNGFANLQRHEVRMVIMGLLRNHVRRKKFSRANARSSMTLLLKAGPLKRSSELKDIS